MHSYVLGFAASARSRARGATYLPEPLEQRVLASGNTAAGARFLDPTFGSAGTVSVDSGGPIAVQPDGKIVVAGTTGDVNHRAFAVARYNADGSPDLAFGPDGTGRVVTDVTPANDGPAAVAITARGEILVAGTNGDFGTTSIAGDFLLVRYTPDGLLDSSFGAGGVVVTDVARHQDIVTGLLPQPDGKVVLAGYDTIGFQGLAASARRIVLARYGDDGSPDGSFGGGGIVLTDLPSSPSESARGAALQPDGGIVVLADVATDFANSHSVLLRYTGAGASDAAFAGGQTSVDVPATGVDVAVAPGGRIVVAGVANPAGDFDFAVLGFGPDGSADRHFGTGGRTYTNFGNANRAAPPPGKADDYAAALAVAPDGSIFLAGTSTTAAAGEPLALPLALARYDANGKPDRRFGEGGRVLAAFGPDLANVSGLAVDAAGKVVAAVSTNSGSMLARFDAEAQPRGSFPLHHGVLRVKGTGGADHVTVAPAGTRFLTVTLNGVSRTVATGDVRRIVVSAGAGDDVLAIDAGVSIPARLFGGVGNDTFFSRDAAADQLLGGPGADAAQKDAMDVSRAVESID